MARSAILPAASLLWFGFLSAVPWPAAAQTRAHDAGRGSTGQQSAAIPDFASVWHRWFRPGLGPSLEGPGPVTNRSRINGVSNYNQLVGDYTNPILTPEAAGTVKARGALSL